MKNGKWVLLFLVIAILLLLSAENVCAKKTIKLTLGQIYAKNHTFSQADISWIDKVQKDTNGLIRIQPFWGATLLSRKEHTKELIMGTADIGYVGPRTGYPIMLKTLNFPYGVSDWKVIWNVYQDLRKQFPQFDAEWKELKIMARAASSNYQLISTKPVHSASDFKGLKIKAAGAFTKIVKDLGAEGMFIPMGETYVGLQKGTIDACLAPYSTIKAFKFNEVAKYITVLNLSSMVRPTRAMNMDSWNRLPEDIKDVFENSIQFWSMEENKWRVKDDEEGYTIAQKAGIEIIELPPKELAKVYKTAEKTILEEATALDKEGYPGTDIFKATRKLIEKYDN